MATMNEKLKQFAQAALQAATGGKSASQKYFQGTKKGETFELKNDLNSDNIRLQKEALKRIIASHTLGKDVSVLFPSVIKCMQTSDIQLKKLIYLYLMNYAVSEPQVALLGINTFCKDSLDSNPVIRALAIRTMSCIPVKEMTDYLVEPLKLACVDRHPYVRKTAAMAILKLYDLDQELVEEHGFLEKLTTMAREDDNPTVVSNALVALSEIHMKGSKSAQRRSSSTAGGGFSLEKLLGLLGDCTEWGQSAILENLYEADVTNEYEAEILLDKVIPRLQHSNPAVVMNAVKVLLRHGEKVNQELRESYWKKVIPPVITLLSHPLFEVQLVTLCQLSYLNSSHSQQGRLAGSFLNLSAIIPLFFCKYNDPLYIKCEKLQLLESLSTKENSDVIIEELKVYCKDVDPLFVAKSIAVLGHIAAKFRRQDRQQEHDGKMPSNRTSQESSRIVHILFSLIETRIHYVVNPCLLVFKNLLLDDETFFVNLILPRLDVQLHVAICDLDLQAKEALIWMVGQYCHLLNNCHLLLEHFIGCSFGDLMEENTSGHSSHKSRDAVLMASFGTATNRSIQLATLGAAVKIFIKMPALVHSVVSDLFQVITAKCEDPDLRDRTIIYWRWLSTDPQSLSACLENIKNKEIETDFPVKVDPLPISMIGDPSQISSIASLYRLPLDDFLNLESSTRRRIFKSQDDEKIAGDSGGLLESFLESVHKPKPSQTTNHKDMHAIVVNESLMKNNIKDPMNLIDLLGDDFKI